VTDEREDNLLNDRFHGHAFAACVELDVAYSRVPDSNTTRRLACLAITKRSLPRFGGDARPQTPSNETPRLSA
jgi:hypothetical protein